MFLHVPEENITVEAIAGKINPNYIMNYDYGRCFKMSRGD